MDQDPAIGEGTREQPRVPGNFDLLVPLLVPSEELATATDIRSNKYVLCSNHRLLNENTPERDNLEDEDWLVELVGDMGEFLVGDKDVKVMYPCTFMQFYRRVLYELGYPDDPQPQVSIWIQHEMAAPAHLIDPSDEGWSTALRNYQNSFLHDPAGNYTAFLYFRFATPPDPALGPSMETVDQVTQGLSGDVKDLPVADLDDYQDEEESAGAAGLDTPILPPPPFELPAVTQGDEEPEPGTKPLDQDPGLVPSPKPSALEDSPEGPPPGLAQPTWATHADRVPGRIQPLLLADPSTQAPRSDLRILKGKMPAAKTSESPHDTLQPVPTPTTAFTPAPRPVQATPSRASPSSQDTPEGPPSRPSPIRVTRVRRIRDQATPTRASPSSLTISRTRPIESISSRLSNAFQTERQMLFASTSTRGSHPSFASSRGTPPVAGRSTTKDPVPFLSTSTRASTRAARLATSQNAPSVAGPSKSLSNTSAQSKPSDARNPSNSLRASSTMSSVASGARAPRPSLAAPRVALASLPRPASRIPQPVSSNPRVRFEDEVVNSLVEAPRAKKTAFKLVGRLRRVGSAAVDLTRKVKEGLRSPHDPVISVAPEFVNEPTILTEMASKAREGGVQDPDGLLPCTQQVDQEKLFRSCSGYLPGVDPSWRDNVRNVRLRNCKLAVTPHQFCTAVNILFAESNTGIAGGLFASAPGTGKTYIMLFAYALRALLFASRRDCQLEWAETDKEANRRSKPAKKLHLPRDQPRGRGQPCPSQRPGFGVCCYCVPDGFTRLTVDKLKPGVALIQVPNGAMPSWLNAVKDAKFDPSVYNVAMFLPAVGMPDGLKNNLGAVDALKRGIKTGAIVPGLHPQPLSKNHMALESYCFVTGHTSTAVDEAFQEFGANAAYDLTGIAFFDESHQVMDDKSKPVQTAQLLRQNRAHGIKADIWHVTATPFGANFEDVMNAIKVLAPQLSNDIAGLAKAYDLAKASDGPNKHIAFEIQFQKFFADKLVIRDSETTTFMGRPITDIQAVDPVFISSQIPESLNKSLQDYINAVLRDRLNAHLDKAPAYVDYLGALKAAKMTNVLYFLTMFPSMAEPLHQMNLAEVVYQDHKLSELVRRLPDSTGEGLTGCLVLADAVDRFSRGAKSPKVRDILYELKRQFHDQTERPDPSMEIAKWHAGSSTRADLTLKKTVIITPTFTTAVFLYLYLRKNHNVYNPLLYHRDMKPSAKVAVLKKFDSLKKEKDTSRVLIAPASVAATGLNLQVANRLILTSPLLKAADEKQALARVNRIGQTLKVGSTILLCEDSPIDRIIVADRARRPILSDPFDLNEVFKVGPGPEVNAEDPAQVVGESSRGH